MAITREQIWAAADELDAAGQNPTLSAVRKAVGGGSFTTIQEAMAEWKARRASREASIQQEPAPQIITDLKLVWFSGNELSPRASPARQDRYGTKLLNRTRRKTCWRPSHHL